MRVESWVFELFFLPFVYLVLREGRIVYGRERASIFLWGSILWTGIIENLAVIMANYDYFAYADYYSFGGQLIKGYGGWVAWIVCVPLTICLGWFFLSFPAVMISMRMFGEKRSIWLKAAFGGLILVSYDVYFDPLAVVNEWWRWTTPSLYIHGVPLSNWIGWFFILFFFGAVYERTVLQLKGFKWLSGIERLIFRTDTSDLAGMDIWRVGRVFYFRLGVFLPIFFITTLIFSLLALNWNNKWGPYNSVFPPTPIHKQYTITPEDATSQHKLPQVLPPEGTKPTGGGQ